MMTIYDHLIGITLQLFYLEIFSIALGIVMKVFIIYIISICWSWILLFLIYFLEILQHAHQVQLLDLKPMEPEQNTLYSKFKVDSKVEIRKNIKVFVSWIGMMIFSPLLSYSSLLCLHPFFCLDTGLDTTMTISLLPYHRITFTIPKDKKAKFGDFYNSDTMVAHLTQFLLLRMSNISFNF